MKLTDELFNNLYKIFDDVFPENMKISKNKLKTNLFSGMYKLILLINNLNKEIIGGFIYNPIEFIERCVFIEYFFISKKYQSCGYGKKFFKECILRLNNYYKYIFLDCEKNLISFYEKLDFSYLGISKINKSGIELHLLNHSLFNDIFVNHWFNYL